MALSGCSVLVTVVELSCSCPAIVVAVAWRGTKCPAFVLLGSIGVMVIGGSSLCAESGPLGRIGITPCPDTVVMDGCSGLETGLPGGIGCTGTLV